MQSSLTSSNHLDPKFLARGASLLAHQLGHKNTNIFRASILGILEGRESPLSPTQLGMVEDILTSPLGAQALHELNHVKYCDFDQEREEHDRAVVDLLKSVTDEYTTDTHKTSQTIKILLKEGENGPVPPQIITSQKLWNTITQKQDSALHAHRLRQFLISLEQCATQLIDAFDDEGTLRFDPQNLVLGVVNEKGDAVLGNDIVHGLTPTGEPGHVFSHHSERYVVCVDQKGKQTIVEYSNRNKFWGFGSLSAIPPKFLDVIPAEDILETRNLQTYRGEPLFMARIKEPHQDEYVLASSLPRIPRIGMGGLSVHDISGDVIVVNNNGGSGSLSGIEIISILTGQELELLDSDGTLEITSDDGVISFNEKTSLKFEGETPNGKEFSEKIGGLFGTRTVTLSQLVQTWKKIAIREARVKR